MGYGMATQAITVTAVREPNERQLIVAGQRGDRHATEALFRRYHGLLFRTALRVLGNTEDAEDALQDGLLSAYRNIRRFEGRSQFSTWLTRIVINAALMKRRSAKVRRVLSIEDIHPEDEVSGYGCLADDRPNPEQVYAGREIGEMIDENLHELSPLLRTAFELHEVAGYSTEEAAEKLGVAENTLKARCWRARHQLAERLGHKLQWMKRDVNVSTGDDKCVESARQSAPRVSMKSFRKEMNVYA
jgi:RNA polymerase sigma-70 factor, ECF subfamily